ncbi:MAG: prolipoprotein diacylglyceryl transferase family protein [Candidatus Hydrogenedentota bacterium]
MGLRIGAFVLTPEGLLLAGALAVFLLASYSRVQSAAQGGLVKTAALLAWVSLCGVAGAALYGIPGSLAAAQRLDPLPSDTAIAFGSFGGYWGVLLGGLVAAWSPRRKALPLLDALTPGILLGGLVARAAVWFAQTTPFSVTPFAIWSLADMALHGALFGVIAIAERRRSPEPPAGLFLITFLIGYGAPRFILEFFRDDTVPWADFTWGHHTSLLQTLAGVVLLFFVLRPRRAAAG